MAAKYRDKRTLITTVPGQYLSFATFPTPLRSHYPLPLTRLWRHFKEGSGSVWHRPVPVGYIFVFWIAGSESWCWNFTLLSTHFRTGTFLNPVSNFLGDAGFGCILYYRNIINVDPQPWFTDWRSGKNSSPEWLKTGTKFQPCEECKKVCCLKRRYKNHRKLVAPP